MAQAGRVASFGPLNPACLSFHIAAARGAAPERRLRTKDVRTARTTDKGRCALLAQFPLHWSD
jgi:hypothetical protein